MSSQLEIRLLGHVSGSWCGRGLPLGPPQQRTVLAVLTLAGGRPVAMRDMVNALWPVSPPRTAVNVVRTYLKRMRQTLDPDRPARQPSSLLPSVGDGYALAADRVDADLWRFRDEMVRVRRERRQGDVARAATRLADALALWRGPVASDLPNLADHPQVITVTAERWRAVGWLAELALTAGTAAEAVGLVEEAAIARPMDEWLHALLIRLYHALGDRGEAVATYQAVSRRLRDELGLSPGPELTNAYRLLLCGSPPVASSAGSAGSVTSASVDPAA